MLNKSELDSFIFSIDGFVDKSLSLQIDYFVYYLINRQAYVIPKDVQDCFNALNLPSHSNISSYLSKNAQGNNKKFIKQSNGYVLNRKLQDSFDKEFKNRKFPEPTNSLFPKELILNTRRYIKEIAFQALSCFDFKLYDACSVMLRKLIETLIIETFERHNLSEKIKDKTGDFLYLSDLISTLLSETTWNIGRNAKAGFVDIKKNGDLSAHNRRYCAKEPDILGIKDSIRICIQELLCLIDYDTWNQSKR